MFHGFTSGGFGALGMVTPCTDAEWSANSDACEIRNLQAFDAAAAPAVIKTAADLVNAIKANNGSLFIWTSNAASNVELGIAKANPSVFTVKAGAQAGEYTITPKAATAPGILQTMIASVSPSAGAKGAAASNVSAEPLGGMLPYLLGGVALVVVLSMLKK